MYSNFKKTPLSQVPDDKINEGEALTHLQSFATEWMEKQNKTKHWSREAARLYAENKLIISRSMATATKPIDAIDPSWCCHSMRRCFSPYTANLQGWSFFFQNDPRERRRERARWADVSGTPDRRQSGAAAVSSENKDATACIKQQSPGGQRPLQSSEQGLLLV